ncbi:hypothetical protein BP6252_10929 [Coleophoma cylindrospora]|uniref:Uncharacterized protein n=1 Tax=Coleophoma cylindrospora TaxID=1849047 RepID=A0A3D8QPK5_9HELO|nr:hypothetical protein BP6252_10929 [Coleophoma cylindrospora]
MEQLVECRNGASPVPPSTGLTDQSSDYHQGTTTETIDDGLEIVPTRNAKEISDYEGREEIPMSLGAFLAASKDEVDYHVPKKSSDTQGSSDMQKSSNRIWKRKYFAVGGAITLIVIVAAVVGGVLGSRKSRAVPVSSTTATVSPIPSSPISTGITTTSI